VKLTTKETNHASLRSRPLDVVQQPGDGVSRVVNFASGLIRFLLRLFQLECVRLVDPVLQLVAFRYDVSFDFLREGGVSEKRLELPELLCFVTSLYSRNFVVRKRCENVKPVSQESNSDFYPFLLTFPRTLK